MGERKECLLLQKRGHAFRKGEKGDTPTLGDGLHGSGQPPEGSSPWTNCEGSDTPVIYVIV